MKSKKLPFLLPVGLALLLSTSILVVSISPTAFGQQQGTEENLLVVNQNSDT